MGNRLTQIATRTGDDGRTGLGDNSRVSKHSARPHAMGDVDELNSHIGLLLCEPLPEDVRTLLGDVQHQLFDLGGELSIPGFELLKEGALAQLDAAPGALQRHAAAPAGNSFCPPARRAAAQAHVCRTVARRAERAVVALGEAEGLRPAPRQYLNRLSDLFFVLARVLNRMQGATTCTGAATAWRAPPRRTRAATPFRAHDHAGGCRPFPRRRRGHGAVFLGGVRRQRRSARREDGHGQP